MIMNKIIYSNLPCHQHRHPQEFWAVNFFYMHIHFPHQTWPVFPFLWQDSLIPPLPETYEPEALGKYGTLDVAFEYNPGEQRLAVTVTAATDIPTLKSTGNISWQVHLVLLPTKKQRAKTGVQKGPCPVFTETFRFSCVEQEALGDYAVRFRLYSVRRMKKEKVLGEKVFYLTKLNMQGKLALPVTLEPGTSVPVSSVCVHAGYIFRSQSGFRVITIHFIMVIL